MRAVRTVLLASLVLLALPAVAHAGWKINRATRTAYIVWGAALWNKCPDGVTVSTVSSATAAYGSDFLRRNGEPGGWYPGGCSIVINTRERELRDYAPFCSTVLHESGHLIGLEHTAHGIMQANPIYARDVTTFIRPGRSSRRVVSWAGTDRRCARNGRPFLRNNVLLGY